MRDLSDEEIGALQELLVAQAAASARPEALDVSALDGWLCGLLLQPERVAESAWLPLVLGGSGPGAQAIAAGQAPAPWLPLVRRRLALLGEAIDARRWFDPWIFPPEDIRPGDDFEAHREAALPWVAGFALACEQFPGLMRLDADALAQPLALLYQYFDAEDLEGLEDEPALAAALAATEPPADLAQAAEDLVRAVLMLADVSRPLPPRTIQSTKQPGIPPVGAPASAAFNGPPGQAPARTGPGRAPPGPQPRSKSARRARARPG